MKKNADDLRKDLEDYYGTAAFSGMGAAFMDLNQVQRESESELVRRAEQNGFDLSRYNLKSWF